MTHGRADGLFIISGTIASTLFLFHLVGEPCHLLPLFSDKLMPSSPKVAKSSLQSVFALCKVLGAPQFFPFFIVLRLGEWWGQWMICCNCFKFWPRLHYKCLQSLLLRSCYSPLSVGMDSMTEAADTATASSTCPNFTGLNIAELSFVEQLLCSR